LHPALRPALRPAQNGAQQVAEAAGALRSAALAAAAQQRAKDILHAAACGARALPHPSLRRTGHALLQHLT